MDSIRIETRELRIQVNDDPNRVIAFNPNDVGFAQRIFDLIAAGERMRRDVLAEEKRLDVLAALLSGDQNTFELFRCEAPELMHLPDATFQWYCENYLDRDYPLRTILRLNGVEFPETLR